LYVDTLNGFYANIHDDIEQIEKLRGGLEAKRKLASSTRDAPSSVGFGFGSSGTLTAAAGAAVTNAGMGLLQGFGDAIGYASDASRVEKEALKGLDRAKQDLLIMGRETFETLRTICQDMLYKDMQEELDALGRVPYKRLSEKQQSEIALKNENYDEAFAEGDIGAER